MPGSGRNQLEVKSRVISLSEAVSSQGMLHAKGTSCYKWLWMVEYRPLITSSSTRDACVLTLSSCPQSLRVVQGRRKSPE